MQALDADFYTFSGHKVFGPTGIGILYGKLNLLEAMPPYQGGGDMIKVVTFPCAILSFGLFLVVINAAIILLASRTVTGFVVYGWVPAFWAAVVLGILGILIKLIMKDG